MIGVTINDERICDEYNLIITNKVISNPEPQTHIIEIPGRNGFIDFSEVTTGNMRYKPRTISIEFWAGNDYTMFESLISILRNKYNGKNVSIIFDDDKAFYWYGRVTSVELSVKGNQGYISMESLVDPYKHSILSSIDDWLWDTLDFEYGEVIDPAVYTVDGILSVELEVTGQWQNPIIIADSIIAYSIENPSGDVTTGSTIVGSKVIYDCILKSGKNKFTFTGNGSVSVVYRGGSL